MLAINNIKNALLKQLDGNGWEIEIEDDYSTFKHFQVFKDKAPLKAFKRLDLILISPVYHPADAEIRFRFYADLRIVNTDKRRFGTKVRENNFEAIRIFCEGVLKNAEIEAREDGISISSRPCPRINFGDGNYSSAAYEVEFVYYNERVSNS